MRGKTQCCRRHVKRKDPRTPAQRRVRIALGGVAKAWGTKLTQEQRQAWELVASRNGASRGWAKRDGCMANRFSFGMAPC